MLFTPHTIIGATIGIATKNPALGYVIGILSHFFLDAFPHVDQSSFYTNEDNGPVWAGAKYEEKKTQLFKVKRDWALLGIDVFMGGIFMLWVLFQIPVALWPAAIFGALGGLTPDLLDVSPLWKYKFRSTAFGKKFHSLHAFLHWPLPKRRWILGLSTQIATMLAGIMIISALL